MTLEIDDPSWARLKPMERRSVLEQIQSQHPEIGPVIAKKCDIVDWVRHFSKVPDFRDLPSEIQLIYVGMTS